jgi:hemerythrin-like domain-containing protein
MCDHCGCREHPPIMELTVDHVEILGMAEALASATRRGQPVDPSLGERLLALLAVHSEKEEVGLYPILIDAMGAPADAFDHLELEHREVEQAIRGGTFDHLVLYALQRHIEEEEEVLFSGALFHFDGDTWDVLEAAHRDVDERTASRTAAVS